MEGGTRMKNKFRHERVCMECKKTFNANLSGKLFCSQACAREYHRKLWEIKKK